ncbi:MAG TPA: diguanylate cyclase [Bryobacteraceae bacterium]|nr:diguanylate cyclase [Bryobacteraceae bacterium]HPU73921.1 diguanylate cyclase [Bryobacteraceae bacterium]
MQVLIADDDAVSRRMLARTLESWHYEVISACDGNEAWRLLQRDDAPQLAILDWMMPGMTGPAVCGALRRRQRDVYTYVLLLTARTEKQALIEGMESGADDYITKPFDAQELKVRLRAGLRILELQAQLVAAREALREQATRDPLTCLWNRYSILDILNREVNRANRDGTGLGVIMADLDHFKRVNDTYGHLAGDAVLRETARRMQAAVRSYDAVGRYGGEEFLIVLPGSGDSSAMQLAERLRETICAEPISIPEGSLRTTMSLGVTAWQRGVYPTPEMLLRAADMGLYRAKKHGRNQVEWVSLQRAGRTMHAR